MADQSIQRFRRVMAVALAHLEDRREEINDLNVFPVADGDTGDNMALTMRAVLEELERLEAESEGGDPKRPEIVRTVARAAMMGARGNSGVILSQIVRGAAEELASPPGRLIDPRLIAAALANAERAAYASIRNPVEGTMLTVAREMAAAVSKKLAHWEQHELSPDASDAEQNALLGAMLAAALEAAGDAVSHTPEQLDVLADAGVVDAGALGLAVIVRGAIAGLAGEQVELPEIPHYAPARNGGVHHADSRYRYCTNFAVIGEGLDRRTYEPLLEDLGDSVLVVGDEATLRVHVHTDDPDAAKALFAEAGQIANEDIADMHEQVAERAARLGGRTAAVAVASGAGLRLLFEDLGAAVVDGGPTLNPSTNDILSAIEAVPTPEVVVLPNSKNVQLAAEEAAKLTSKEAVVVPTVSQQGALAALVELDRDAGAGDNAKRLGEVLAAIRVGGVAPAAKPDVEGRFEVGESVGFEEDQVIAWGEAASTLTATVQRLAEGAEIVTVIEGEDPPVELGQLDLGLPDGVEVELHRGGQPNWHWLIAAQ
jgi:DAK2 domain fusion protein YloV